VGFGIEDVLVEGDELLRGEGEVEVLKRLSKEEGLHLVQVGYRDSRHLEEEEEKVEERETEEEGGIGGGRTREEVPTKLKKAYECRRARGHRQKAEKT